jgi:hypothetical protein
MSTVYCWIPFDIMFQYLPLWVAKTISITLPTGGCVLNFLTGDMGCFHSRLWCLLTGKSGASMFCSHYWCDLRRSHLAHNSDSKDADRFPNDIMHVHCKLFWNTSSTDSTKAKVVMDNLMGRTTIDMQMGCYVISGHAPICQNYVTGMFNICQQ